MFDADDDSEDETGQPSPSSDDVLEWDASRLRCLEQLQQWDKLLENTITSLDIPYSESGPDISCVDTPITVCWALLTSALTMSPMSQV